jgi:hypothetical protein
LQASKVRSKITTESNVLTIKLINKTGKFYTGWTHGHYVTNLLGFGPGEMIIFGVINAPGSIDDSSLASFFGIYEKLQAVYDKTGSKVIMDLLFVQVNLSSS